MPEDKITPVESSRRKSEDEKLGTTVEASDEPNRSTVTRQVNGPEEIKPDELEAPDSRAIDKIPGARPTMRNEKSCEP